MEDRKKYTLYFALLFPFFGMLAALYYHRDKYARLIFWFGCVYLGFVHIFNPIFETGADGVRYAQRLTEFAEVELNFETIKELFYSNGENNDIYQQSITLLVSRFTTNAHVLFAVFAAIMGFFYSGNIWMVLNKFDNSEKKWFVWLLIVMLIMLVPIYQINGVRMWTGLHVFVYGALSYFLRNNKSALLWIIATPLIHFSYIFFVFLFFLFLLLPKKGYFVYFLFFFLSAFVDNLQDIIPVKDFLLKYSPAFLHSKINEYMIDGYSEYEAGMMNELTLYVKLVPMSLKVFIYFFIAYIWINFKKIVHTDEQKKMLFLFLFLAGVVQLLSSLPQMVRFDRLIHVFFFVYAVLLFSDKVTFNKKVYKYGVLISFLLLLPLFFSFRIGAEYYGFSMLIGNFLTAIFIEDNHPFILLKDFLL